MPEPLRACPYCHQVTANRYCRHGKNLGYPTLTLAQYRKRVTRYQASAKLIQAAIAALESAGR